MVKEDARTLVRKYIHGSLIKHYETLKISSAVK